MTQKGSADFQDFVKALCEVMSFWCLFGVQGTPGRLPGHLEQPRRHFGVPGAALGWPQGRPGSKIYDFAETVAYFKGFSFGSAAEATTTWGPPRIISFGSAAEAAAPIESIS